MYYIPNSQTTNAPPGELPQGQIPQTQQKIIRKIYYIQQPTQNQPPQQQFYAQPANPQILAQPSLNYNQSSAPSNYPLMQQQISLKTEPVTQTHLNTVQNLNQQEKPLEFDDGSFSYLISKVQVSKYLNGIFSYQVSSYCYK
ncbi:hypothetical protein TTHERM_00300400 (macronuclear) [Tetrahymena thermophila SB210]|uniref:Uncharacterized protein n=1 Tax=Tetrahymena thermophila (strain SB210) TaxID=312017 RepID=I7M3U6_TETTS|nr:hypothetical protein TTHERM_00300400 [Tetrahymena thermophila SB210]EAS04322.2 hypothetical protein TTHERM_00300400 [Tetrahymena thermophila SB210]|eukprot:XP_001024567.2 hypothetical protein TTHERM_00300400 [Tetrahymena thermophila SB210]